MTVVRGEDGLVEFAVTDDAAIIFAWRLGITPDVFGDGRALFTQGMLSREGIILADAVPAKLNKAYVRPKSSRPCEIKANGIAMRRLRDDGGASPARTGERRSRIGGRISP